MSETSKYPWYIRLIFRNQRKKYGYVLNSALVWGKSPGIFLALSWLYGQIDRKISAIFPAMEALVLVRVSQINGCRFCVDLNTSMLIRSGVDLGKVKALGDWRTSELFSARERLVLEYAEVVSDSKGDIDGDLRKEMSANFSEKEIVELTALIAYQNMSTKFNNAFGVEPQGFCEVPGL